MTLKKVFIIMIIALSETMGKVKPTTLRVYESDRPDPSAHGALINYHGYQTRHHNHLLHKKHFKCHFERMYGGRRGHLKKQSRYPTLDKIVNRLDNKIDRGLAAIRLTTANPFEQWNASLFGSSSARPSYFPDKQSKYAYVTIDGKNGMEEGADKAFGSRRQDSWSKQSTVIKLGNANGESDNEVRFTTSSKGFLQDFTTSGPWDNEQGDVSPTGTRGHEDRKSTSSSALLLQVKPSSPASAATIGEIDEERRKSFEEKSTSWSFASLVPRLAENDERKKKSSKMPYVAAHEHYEQVLKIGDCHTPKQKVIKVHEVHPDPSKSYSPSCTILHQCGDDTGCCRDLKQVCKPKNTTKVELYFFTTTLGKPQTVEKLYFVNHTECECQKRTDESMPRDSEFRAIHFKKYFSASVNSEKRKPINCTCPSKYSTRYFRNDTCTCDCFDKQDDCLILKKGKAHFSYSDKLCIQEGVCLLPSCEFGTYIRQFGRCPNRRENDNYRTWFKALPSRNLIT